MPVLPLQEKAMSPSAMLRIAVPALLAALVSTACTTQPPAEPPGPRQAAQAAAPQEREPMTGSRIPRKSVDQMLHTIDAAGAREMDRARPPNPGPRIQ
jgi:hypothetical protein